MTPPWSCDCSAVRLCVQTAVDDKKDEDRVNCVLTSLLAAQGIMETTHAVGTAQDIEIADLVSINHEARFFLPARGFEIIVSAVCVCVCVCTCS